MGWSHSRLLHSSARAFRLALAKSFSLMDTCGKPSSESENGKRNGGREGGREGEERGKEKKKREGKGR